MARRHHYKRRTKVETDLDMTTFLNLMVVLVPFLLITAVFSRITIVELSLPSSTGGEAPIEPEFRVEIVVRESGVELTDGQRTIAKMPKVAEEYDLVSLTEHVYALKMQNPDSSAASVLLEPHIEYDHLIHVMDAVRSTTEPGEIEGELAKVTLFPDISIGDAP